MAEEQTKNRGDGRACPVSGKSTWLERQGIVAISSDWIRQVLADDATDQTIHARVFLTMRYLLRHRLAIGRPVSYVDATHLTPEERRPYIQIGQWYGCDVEALYFDVPRRSAARETWGAAGLCRMRPWSAWRRSWCRRRWRKGFAGITIVR